LGVALVAAGLDDGQEVPAEVGFGLGGEGDGQNASRLWTLRARLELDADRRLLAIADEGDVH
jgi:hypothetical protein